MAALTVNTGSSSIRLAIFSADGRERLAQAHYTGAAASTDPRSQLRKFLDEHPTYDVAVVAHRVVHGGAKLTQPRLIDAEVKAEIERAAPLAPSHNPIALRWIEVCADVLGKNVPQVAAFDDSPNSKKGVTMKRSHFFTLLLLAPLSLSLLLSGAAPADSDGDHGKMMGGQAAPQKEPELKTLDELRQEIKALRKRVATLEELKPGFTNFMPNYSERFHVMHRAGDVGDWSVAAHEIDEMQRLTRVSKYIDPKLGGLMQGFMDGNLRKLREAVEHGNPKSFQAAMKDTVASCNGCHQASGSTIAVTLNVEDSLNMRHPHALKKSTVPKDHGH